MRYSTTEPYKENRHPFEWFQGLSQHTTRNTINGSEIQAGHQEQCSSCEISQDKEHDVVNRSHDISLAETTYKTSTGLQPCSGQRQAKRAPTVSPAQVPWSIAIPLHVKLFHWLQSENKINPANISEQLAVSATSHPAESICPLQGLLTRSLLLSPCQILYIWIWLASPDARLD